LINWKIQQKLAEDKNPELSRKEERKKKSGGKHGGGTQVIYKLHLLAAIIYI